MKRARHAKFGEGLVLAEAGQTLTVEFPTFGTKKLHAQYLTILESADDELARLFREGRSSRLPESGPGTSLRLVGIDVADLVHLLALVRAAHATAGVREIHVDSKTHPSETPTSPFSRLWDDLVSHGLPLRVETLSLPSPEADTPRIANALASVKNLTLREATGQVVDGIAEAYARHLLPNLETLTFESDVMQASVLAKLLAHVAALRRLPRLVVQAREIWGASRLQYREWIGKLKTDLPQVTVWLSAPHDPFRVSADTAETEEEERKAIARGRLGEDVPLPGHEAPSIEDDD